MPAFDVTASPTQLTLKAGETGTVVVTVTNRLGCSVIARADKIVEPASAAGWARRRRTRSGSFSDQPATEEFRYEITIPPNTPGTSVKFRVDVVEVGATDDNFGQGNTVQVTVPAVVIKPPPPPKIPYGSGRRGRRGDWRGHRGLADAQGWRRDAERRRKTVRGRGERAAEGKHRGGESRQPGAPPTTTKFPAGAVMAQTPAPDSALKGPRTFPTPRVW